MTFAFMAETKTSFVDAYREQAVITLIVIAVLAIYAQTAGFSFVNFDDNLYVYDNAAVIRGLTADTFKWAFSSFHSSNWHPMTWLSHAADVSMFGLDPGRHHTVNVFLHLLNSIFAFYVFKRMTGCFWRSAIVALLFAVHPAHVESVAWVSERKDLLSTLFWLLTMLAYVRFCERRGEASVRERILSPEYGLVLPMFLFGLLSKPMVVTLPFVLLLCDYWPLERLRTRRDVSGLVLEKLPLLALTIASSAVTFYAQRAGGAVSTFEHIPLGSRFWNAASAYAKYIWMSVAPTRLAVWYPYDFSTTLASAIVPTLIVAGITAMCIWQLRDRKYLAVGWFWFLGTLVPVIGVVQVGTQSMADRYTYIPYFGLFIIAAWGLPDLLAALRAEKRIAFVVLAAVIAAFAFAAHTQASYWRNNETLYRRALAVTTDNYLVSHNLCNALMNAERLDEAETLCRDAIRLRPGYAAAYNTLGVIEFKLGRYGDAETDFRKSLELGSSYYMTYSNLGVTLAVLGRPEEAEENLKRAAESTPAADAGALFSKSIETLAGVYASQRKFEKAIENFRRVLSLDPERTDVRVRLANALHEAGKDTEAAAEIGEALNRKPDDPVVNYFAGIIAKGSRPADAAKYFRRAIELKPDLEEAKKELSHVERRK